MEEIKLKLVDYSESSGSNSSPESKIKHQYPKIAVVNPVQSVRPESEQEPPTSQHDETTEFDPDESLTRQPIPSSSEDPPEEARRESDIPEPDITDLTFMSENPEPEPEMIIILSSESETVSIRTDTTLGLYQMSEF